MTNKNSYVLEYGGHFAGRDIYDLAVDESEDLVYVENFFKKTIKGVEGDLELIKQGVFKCQNGNVITGKRLEFLKTEKKEKLHHFKNTLALLLKSNNAEKVVAAEHTFMTKEELLLETLRSTKGMTKEELAKVLGTTTHTIRSLISVNRAKGVWIVDDLIPGNVSWTNKKVYRITESSEEYYNWGIRQRGGTFKPLEGAPRV